LRALDVLTQVDEVLAEDTRMARRLLDAHGIRAKLSPYHDHNGAQRRPDLLKRLAEGARVALVSDAGTPLVSDPGWKLVQEAIEAGHRIVPVPGPSAALAGLVASGLPSDRFCFCGFLPPRSGARRRTLQDLAAVPATLIFYESASRLAASLSDMADMLGAQRPAAVARELTKLFEETRRAPLGQLKDHYLAEGPPKGEIVLLVGPPVAAPTGETDLESALVEALRTQSVKAASAEVAEALGLPRRQVYQKALALRETQD
jgi:16S rRNA (cytidine1402-2'-O)-methyltransferase